MRYPPKAARRGRRHWWAVALCAMLATLGHDVLMAAATHAAQRSPAVHHTEHGQPDIQVTDNGPSTVHGKAPTPNHPGACNVTRTVALRPVDDDADPTTGAVSSLTAAVIDPMLAGSFPPHWAEPITPPRVRRALLQVYLV